MLTEYQTSDEEYKVLKANAKGGTKLSWANVPDWRGVWQRQEHGPRATFDEAAGVNSKIPPYGASSAQLTARYQADYDNTVAEIVQGREWERSGSCLPEGYPRWLAIPLPREFIVTPDEVVLTNEQINETRRIYTDGRGHIPEKEAVPLWMGDSVGFWTGPTLVVHTNHLKAGTYMRGQPAYSFQVTTVEQWTKIKPGLIHVKVSVYDPPALVRPWHVEFYYERLSDPGVRLNFISCEENNNVVQKPDGGTTFVFAGDPRYHDPDTYGIPEVAWDTIPK